MSLSIPSTAQAQCSKHYGYSSAKRGIHVGMTKPKLSRRQGAHVWMFQRCARSHRPELARYIKRLRVWRRSHYWLLAFKRMPGGEQRWAKVTGACESGNDPGAHSPNGDHGAMQFKLATAYAAGFHTDPHNTGIYEQYVRAIRWKWRAGAGQWPVCGH